jgi:hypothetical protein
MNIHLISALFFSKKGKEYALNDLYLHPKIRARVASNARVFGEPFRTTTVFLSSFCERVSSFFCERRKKNAEIKHKVELK